MITQKFDDIMVVELIVVISPIPNHFNTRVRYQHNVDSSFSRVQ